MKGRLVQVLMNNTLPGGTAINKAGGEGKGSRTLCQEALHFWNWLEHQGNFLVVNHLAGSWNAGPQPSAPSGLRMAVTPRGGAGCFLLMGRTLFLSAHHRRECAMPALLHGGISNVSLGQRCVPLQVELRTPVRLSSDTIPAPSNEAQERYGPSNFNGAGLGMEHTVSRIPGLEYLSSEAASLGPMF